MLNMFIEEEVGGGILICWLCGACHFSRGYFLLDVAE